MHRKSKVAITVFYGVTGVKEDRPEMMKTK